MASDTKNNDNYGFNNINECNVNRANIINNVQQNIITKINQILHGDEHNYYTKSNVNGGNDHSTDPWNDSVAAVTVAAASAVDQQQIQQAQKKQEHTATINKLNYYPNLNPNPHSNSNPNNYRSTPEENHVQSSNNSVNSFSNSRNHFNSFNNGGYTPTVCPNQEQYQADYWPDKGIVKTSFKPQFMDLIDFSGPWHLNESKLDLPNGDRTLQLTRNQYFSNAHHAPASGKNLSL